MTSNQRLAEVWEGNRAHLINLAFRMLGDIGEAEDIVQEAFARLIQVDVDSLDDARGWLIVVTSRLCLDQIKSARSRRQRTSDLHTYEATMPGAGPAFVDPADRITLDDNVRLALIVVLDRLSPAERVVFVLHEIFEMPFDVVGETVGKSAAACRQLAHRGRVKVAEAGGRTSFGIPAPEHRLVTERFIDACANGNLAGLLEVLDPEVSGEVDVRPRQVVVGAESVAENILRFWGWRATLVSHQVGDRPALLAFVERELRAVLVLTVRRERISKIHVIASPPLLDFLQRRHV